MKVIKPDSEPNSVATALTFHLNHSLQVQDWFMYEEKVCKPLPVKITNSSLEESDNTLLPLSITLVYTNVPSNFVRVVIKVEM